MSTFIDRDGSSGGGSGPSYTEDSFTITLNGVVGTVTATAVVIKIGNMVQLTVPQIVGATSNAATKSFSGIPVAYRPPRNLAFFCIPGLANSVVGGMLLLTNGNANLLLYDPTGNAIANTWPSSGSILFNGISVAYSLI